MNKISILIPMLSQPNFLSVCLRGLIRNSRLKNRIIVIWSDPSKQGMPPANDYICDYDALVNEGRNKAYQKYSSIPDYMERKADFIAENNIEFVDVTELSYEFMLAYKAGKVWRGNIVKPANTPWEGGQDIAWKDNYGINMTTSEYVMPNWDADFYPSPGWDEIMLEFAEKMAPRSIFVPAHVQPLEFEEVPEGKNIWNDFKYVSCARATLPISLRGGTVEFPNRGGNTVTDEELESAYAKHAQKVILRELPGVRGDLHHFPVLYRTEELKNIIGPYNYQGAGYDLEIDDRCGKWGFMKFTDRRVWCIHKAYVAVKPEWV